MEKMDLTQLDVNRQAIVTEIEGGPNIVKRLVSIGIRPGVSIKKISAHFWKGPVTVHVGRTKIAVGYGIAKKIVVEV